jgi:predicted TIM-barrel fold metal-dependent hydrolase
VNAAARRIPATWNIDINAALPVIVAMKDTLLNSPRPVVLDHFGHAKADAGLGQPGFAELLALLKSGRVFVKVSGPYQISKERDYGDVAAIAKALIAAAPQQIVWGSDWPHTGGANRPANQPIDVVEAFRDEDDGKNLDLLLSWVSDRALLRQILVETPARLYGFKTEA